MTYEEVISSNLSVEEKNQAIAEIRENEYLKLRPTPRDQIEYESRHGSGTVREMKDEIRILYPYI